MIEAAFATVGTIWAVCELRTRGFAAPTGSARRTDALARDVVARAARRAAASRTAIPPEITRRTHCDEHTGENVVWSDK